eukprot:352526-Chlamydomonas_euryale.AAC.3
MDAQKDPALRYLPLSQHLHPDQWGPPCEPKLGHASIRLSLPPAARASRTRSVRGVHPMRARVHRSQQRWCLNALPSEAAGLTAQRQRQWLRRPKPAAPDTERRAPHLVGHRVTICRLAHQQRRAAASAAAAAHRGLQRRVCRVGGEAELELWARKRHR